MIIVKQFNGDIAYYNVSYIKSMNYSPKNNILQIADQNDEIIVIMPNNEFNPIVLETAEYKNITINEKS